MAPPTAGGSGITPVISIAKSALAQGGGKVLLVYANRDESSVIFASDLASLADKHPDRIVVMHGLESIQGQPTSELMKAIAAEMTDRDAFVCGPGPFMSGVVQALKDLGFPRERRHQEKFISRRQPLRRSRRGRAGEIEAAETEAGAEDSPGAPLRTAPASVEGDLDGEALALGDWPPGKPLLDFLLEKGQPAPYSWRQGKCSACACLVSTARWS